MFPSENEQEKMVCSCAWGHKQSTQAA